MHACIRACMHACIHACVHTCIHAYIHPSIHPCMHMHAYTPTCLHARIHTYIHACMHLIKHSLGSHTGKQLQLLVVDLSHLSRQSYLEWIRFRENSQETIHFLIPSGFLWFFLEPSDCIFSATRIDGFIVIYWLFIKWICFIAGFEVAYPESTCALQLARSCLVLVDHCGSLWIWIIWSVDHLQPPSKNFRWHCSGIYPPVI